MPTVTEIRNQARVFLADDRVSGGELYTDTILLAPAQSAVRDLFRALRTLSDSRIIKTVYYVLPAETSILLPSVAGITDLLSPFSIESRTNLTEKVASAATQASTPTRLSVTTTTPHTFTTGDKVTQTGFGGMTGEDGLWTITVTGASTYDANGCLTTGTFTSGGVIVKSGEDFRDMLYLDRIHSATTAQKAMNSWAWEDGKFSFPGISTRHQLRIRYYSTDPAPTSGSDIIDVPDSLDFLAFMTASYATMTISPSISDKFRAIACGSSGQPDCTGGLILQVLNTIVKTRQDRDPEERSRPPFRNHFYSELWL